MLEGEIEVESEINIGTTVRFYIKQEPNPYLDVVRNEVNVSSDTANSEQGSHIQPLILIGEDENIGRKTIELMLRGKYRLIFAMDGQETIEKYFEFKPDLLLIDIMMPGLNGYEVYSYIRQHDHKNDVPIIAITARAIVGEKEKILDHGFDDYIPKPIHMDTLLNTLEKYKTPE